MVVSVMWMRSHVCNTFQKSENCRIVFLSKINTPLRLHRKMNLWLVPIVLPKPLDNSNRTGCWSFSIQPVYTEFELLPWFATLGSHRAGWVRWGSHGDVIGCNRKSPSKIQALSVSQSRPTPLIVYTKNTQPFKESKKGK